MKKYIISALVVVAIGVFIVYEVVTSHSSSVAAVPASGTPSVATVSTSTDSGASASSTASSNGTPPNQTAAASSGQYTDGTYTSPVEDAYYGKLQLAVTISGGKITDITWPVYPNEAGHTVQVSTQDLPVLKTEALASQSANVDIVSGATQTSQAFQQALTAVLAQA